MANTTRHHRKPQSEGVNDDPTNISHVPIKKHQAWHTLFRDFKPEKIASIINQIWLDPDYKFFAYRKRKFRKIRRSKLKWSKQC